MQEIGALRYLAAEARSLLVRLDRIRAFSLQAPMVPAAAVPSHALVAIEQFLFKGRAELRRIVLDYIHWLEQGNERIAPRVAQQRFTIIRLRFNDILSQVDIFADVLNQRSEHETGVWISALDVVAADALKLPGNYYETPPVICYLDRGHGAAIRRARTRLPGGKENPVAIIRVPRERMIGNGIASSLVHEVGHQGAALLDLLRSIRPMLIARRDKSRGLNAWVFWERWISEIISDFWSVSKLGIASTFGLIGVVSLPRAFVFRMLLDDPHPFPWIRVKLSCAMGNALYPHPQWERLSNLWDSLYPLDSLSENKRTIISLLMESMPGFVEALLSHRPRALYGESLLEVFSLRDRKPQRLQAYADVWIASPRKMLTAPPSLVFAVIGQARSHGKITPERESNMLSKLFKHWALNSTFDGSETYSQDLYKQPLKVIQETAI
jgi:hypothetical protein